MNNYSTKYKTLRKVKVNQYATKRKNLNGCLATCGIILSLIVIFLIRRSNAPIVTAYIDSSDVYAVEKVTPTATPTPTPSELEEIVSYITRVFEKEGKDVVVWAIKCFYSESGLRTEAVNDRNSNGSVDRGIAQVNSVHNFDSKELHTIKGNIDAAYKIYKSQGSHAWYGKECN